LGTAPRAVVLDQAGPRGPPGTPTACQPLAGVAAEFARIPTGQPEILTNSAPAARNSGEFRYCRGEHPIRRLTSAAIPGTLPAARDRRLVRPMPALLRLPHKNSRNISNLLQKSGSAPTCGE